MFRTLRKPSPATILSIVALVFASAGTATAASLLTGAQIKNGSLTGIDVKNGTLKSVDVANGSLLALDFKAGQLPAGPQGPQGPQGPAGPQGAPGVSGLEVVTAQTGFDSLAFKGVIVSCPAGKKVLGGGASVISPSTDVALSGSQPTSSGTGWHANAAEVNPTASLWLVRAHAICANVA